VVALIIGIQPFLDYAALFFEIANLHEQPDYPLNTQYSILSLYRRYLGIGRAADLWGWLTVAVFMGISAWALGRKPPSEHEPPSQLLQRAGLSWVTAVLFNPHLHHYDLVLVSAAGLMALAEWSMLSRGQRVILAILLSFNHLAFVIVDTLQINDTLPLPLFATVAIWGWLFWRFFLAQRQEIAIEMAAQG
jgi:hypothetical protein